MNVNLLALNFMIKIKLILQLNKKLPQFLQNPFTILKGQYHQDRKNAGCRISLPQVTTKNYGLHSITYKAAETGTIFKVK